MLKSSRFETEQIKVILPFHSPNIHKVQSRFKIQVFYELPTNIIPEAIIFAVKPQIFPEILDYYSKAISKDTLIISIAAGKSLEYFKKHFPQNKIVRTMPNINATVGHGTTVGVCKDFLSALQIQLVENIFTSVGSFTWIDDESLIDPVTAISGSGPAYYFLFTEFLENAARELGLSENLAKKLARETFIGSAHLLAKSDLTISELRDAVTSKGGTTEAALKIFNDGDVLSKLIKKATQAASKKGKELSK